MIATTKRALTRLVMMLGMLAVITGLVGFQPASADDQPAVSNTHVSEKTKGKNKSKQKCIKSKKSTSASSGVLSSSVCISVDLLKENKCLARAVKREQPAPPRDPKSVCKGKMKVQIKATIKTAPCPPGWYGGQAMLKIKFRQVTKVYAMAQSIASGNSSTLAQTYISIKDKVKGWTKSDCVQVPPPPNPEPTFSCDMLAVTESSGRSVNISAFSAPGSNGAVFKHAIIEWGDGSSETFTSPVGKSHTYGADGSYTIRASAVFMVNGEERTVTSAGCQAAVSFNTPPPPPPPSTPDSLTISGWSSWHFIQDSDGGWNEVTAESNGKTVGFSAPSVKSGPCAIVESSVVTHSATKKTQQIRVRPLTGQTGTCVITTRATAGSASEPWEGIIEIAPVPPGSWD